MTSIIETQKAIKFIKTTFENDLSENLNMIRVSAPIFVRTKTGVQDDLAGICKSIKFYAPSCNYKLEVIHSLAKWKRIALKRYDIPVYHGLYTDMNAIRKDEKLDFMHSLYVDQFDFEIHITDFDQNEKFLRETVVKIYDAMRYTEKMVRETFKHVQTCYKMLLFEKLLQSQLVKKFLPWSCLESGNRLVKSIKIQMKYI